MRKIYKALGHDIYSCIAIFLAGVGGIELSDENYVVGVIVTIIAFGMAIWLGNEIKRLEHENFKLECWCEHIQETINRDMEV